MKFSSIAAGYLYGISSMILLPLLLLYVNEVLQLPKVAGYIPEILGMILILGGGVLLWFSVASFKKHGGKGSPLPFDPPNRLVTQGIFKHSRNPMFVASAMIWIGEFLFFGSLLLLPYALGWIVFNHIHLVTKDEKWLEKRFGRAYRDYKQETKRYIPYVI